MYLLNGLVPVHPEFVRNRARRLLRFNLNMPIWSWTLRIYPVQTPKRADRRRAGGGHRSHQHPGDACTDGCSIIKPNVYVNVLTIEDHENGVFYPDQGGVNDP